MVWRPGPGKLTKNSKNAPIMKLPPEKPKLKTKNVRYQSELQDLLNP